MCRNSSAMYVDGDMWREKVLITCQWCSQIDWAKRPLVCNMCCVCFCPAGMEDCGAEYCDDNAEITINTVPGYSTVTNNVVDNKLADVSVGDALPVKLLAENVTPIIMQTEAVNLQPLDAGKYCQLV